jgi:hypothetical protein
MTILYEKSGIRAWRNEMLRYLACCGSWICPGNNTGRGLGARAAAGAGAHRTSSMSRTRAFHQNHIVIIIVITSF